MTDDHTTQAISCYGGNLVQTPNLDRLAHEGIRMDRCYATNALSGPSRACVLTGKMSHINGFTDNASRFNSWTSLHLSVFFIRLVIRQALWVNGILFPSLRALITGVSLQGRRNRVITMTLISMRMESILSRKDMLRIS